MQERPFASTQKTHTQCRSRNTTQLTFHVQMYTSHRGRSDGGGWKSATMQVGSEKSFQPWRKLQTPSVRMDGHVGGIPAQRPMTGDSGLQAGRGPQCCPNVRWQVSRGYERCCCCCGKAEGGRESSRVNRRAKRRTSGSGARERE